MSGAQNPSGSAGQESGVHSRRPHRSRDRIVLVASLVAVALAGVVAWAVLVREAAPVPVFPRLSAEPDPALQGTVAYTSGTNRCVRIIAASGGASKDVLCLGVWKPDPSAVRAGFKEANLPQLVWLPGGRLQITGILMQVSPAPAGRPPVYRAAWQKIVDVRTGQVADVPAADLPSGPTSGTRPTTSPDGRRVSFTSDDRTGEVSVRLTDATGTRTLMSAHGPGTYTYGLRSAFWAPNWQWIAADDGRILVITPGTPSTTQILVDGSGDPEDFPTFAITAENLAAG